MEEQVLSEAQLHREGTLIKVCCYNYTCIVHNTTDILSAFLSSFLVRSYCSSTQC